MGCQRDIVGVDRAPPRVSGQRMNLEGRPLLQSGLRKSEDPHALERTGASQLCDAAQMGAQCGQVKALRDRALCIRVMQLRKGLDFPGVITECYSHVPDGVPDVDDAARRSDGRR